MISANWIPRSALIGAVLFLGVGTARAVEPIPESGPVTTVAKAEKKQAKAASRQPSGSKPVETEPSPAGPVLTELLLGFGGQTGGGVSLPGISVDLRLPARLPWELRPFIATGAFANFQQNYFTLPVCFGLFRPFPLHGVLGGKSAATAGLELGFLFTSEAGRNNDFLLLAQLGWEIRIDKLTPFIQLIPGLRAGGFIFFPRFGFVLDM